MLENWGRSYCFLTTALDSLFLDELKPDGAAVWSLTPRSATLYRACGQRDRQRGEEEKEKTKAGEETRWWGFSLQGTSRASPSSAALFITNTCMKGAE